MKEANKKRTGFHLALLYQKLLGKIESPRYWCIHHFFKDFGLFVQADEVLVYQETENDWDVICNIKNDSLGDKNRAEELKNQLKQVYLKKIIWLPGEMRNEKSDYNAPYDICVIPIWRDAGYSIKKCVIVLVKPRLLNTEKRLLIETIVSLEKHYYRVIYYWLTKSFYEHRIRSHMCKQIVESNVSLDETDKSIKSSDKRYRGLIERELGWPANFKEVKELFSACWFVYLRIIEARKTSDKSKKEKIPKKAFWERDGCQGNDRALWEYLERKAQEKLCHPYPLCKNPVCPPGERTQKRLFAEICNFVKWPLLFEEKKYDYLTVPKEEGQEQDERKKKQHQFLKERSEQVASFNKTTPFLELEEVEEETKDGSKRKRSFVSFC